MLQLYIKDKFKVGTLLENGIVNDLKYLLELSHWLTNCDKADFGWNVLSTRWFYGPTQVDN